MYNCIKEKGKHEREEQDERYTAVGAGFLTDEAEHGLFPLQ